MLQVAVLVVVVIQAIISPVTALLVFQVTVLSIILWQAVILAMTTITILLVALKVLLV